MPVSSRESSKDSLEIIASEIVNCSRCPRLVAWREEAGKHPPARFANEQYWSKGVPGFGDPQARIVIVGLAPAAGGANRTGRMFTGDRSGEWLIGSLFRTGLANQPHSERASDGLFLRHTWLTAVIRCAPPQNRPSTQERDNCIGYLARELELLKDANVFLALGGFAFSALATLLDISPRPRFSHGAEVALQPPPGNPGNSGKFLLGCYHPSQQNTFTRKLTQPMLDAAMNRAKVLARL
jgi:uracil-DNA glycosylase family 4